MRHILGLLVACVFGAPLGAYASTFSDPRSWEDEYLHSEHVVVGTVTAVERLDYHPAVGLWQFDWFRFGLTRWTYTIDVQQTVKGPDHPTFTVMQWDKFREFDLPSDHVEPVRREVGERLVVFTGALQPEVDLPNAVRHARAFAATEATYSREAIISQPTELDAAVRQAMQDALERGELSH